MSSTLLKPIIDGAFNMGRISGAVILSDVYGCSAHNAQYLAMNLVGRLHEEEIVRAMERGFSVSYIWKNFFYLLILIRFFNLQQAAIEVGVQRMIMGSPTGSPWCSIMGYAVATCDILLARNQAEVGDVLVLTKPLGTKVALLSRQTLHLPDYTNYGLSIQRAYRHAIKSMVRLNRNASSLMHHHNVHGAIDINGASLVPKANELVLMQRGVSFLIERLPVIASMAAFGNKFPVHFSLLQGRCIEMSGGLLICLPPWNANNYITAIREEEGYPPTSTYGREDSSWVFSH